MTEHKITARAEIMNMAKELGLALAGSQEILDYREAEKKMARDEEACRLTRIFKETHKALAKLKMESRDKRGEIAELEARLKKADRNMKANPLIASYYRAGGAFNTLVYQINQLLKFYCMEPEEELQFEQGSISCGGCEGCGGKSCTGDTPA
jgi:cell fate (sporulation/competence/biofilm development) regulator YlbF (YheA/YmcA/DUF963 family)